MKLARLLLRTTVGGLFVGHGTQKLFSWFGGGGLDATGQMFDSIGVRPGRRNAIVAGVAEAGGGAALALGLATPLAGAALTATMLTAINRVHLKNGPWVTNGGYEYNLVLIAAALAAIEDPGPLTLDRALGREHTGAGWALAAAGAGVAGALGAHLAAEAAGAPAPEPAMAEAPTSPENGSEPAGAAAGVA